MHADFISSTGKNVSKSFYFKAFKEMNISMANLGNEQCEVCHLFSQHKQKCNCQLQCEEYPKFVEHKRNYKEARIAYNEDKNIDDDKAPIFSADMQKVLLLPQMDQFKANIFTPRLCIFNETFAEIGDKAKEKVDTQVDTNETTKTSRNPKRKLKKFGDTVVVWHEAIAGRCDEDVASSFHNFFKQHRDAERLTIWLDNCAYQNKNWTLFTMINHLINQPTFMSAEKITLKYFEKGHTFMAADSVHSRIENVLSKRKGTIFDYDDLNAAFVSAGCKVINLDSSDFTDWKSGLSNYKFRTADPRPILAELKWVQFRKGEPNTLFFKKSFTENTFIFENFIKKSFEISTQGREAARGIQKAKKDRIINDLLPLMPLTRVDFWKKLPENNTSSDLLSSRI